jgi:rhodanese-related sulfurtransferase
VPTQIERREVQRLMDQGAQVVEVLPKEEYEEEHLPGAINLPLRELEDQATELLDRDRPVVVYCWDDP